MPLHLHPDRLLPADPAVRALARRLHDSVRGLPILSPHGHVDARLLVEDEPFADPASLLIAPDHYVTRLLHADGVPLHDLGVGRGPLSEDAARTAWRRLCEHWPVFRGTPVRYWLEAELGEVFGVEDRPAPGTADRIYDRIAERLAQPDFRPRALFERFGIDVLATTDDPCDDLAAHRALAEDAAWRARAEVDDPDFRASPEHGLVDVHTNDPAVARDGAVLDVRYGSGAQPAPGPGGEHHRAELALYAADTSRARPAAVATDAFLEARGARVGDTTTIEVRGTPVEIRVTGAVRALPTTSPRDEGVEGGALLMDLGTLQDALWDRFVPGPQPGEWWLAVEPGEVEAVAAALRDRPDDVSLLVRDESARELASDPLGAGPRSALSAVALAAAVLAAAGFAVVTVGALRERAVDFAVLRALGAPRSRIAAAVAVEQGFLTVAAVGLGAVAGSVLTHLIVPLTVVTAQASRPEPEVGVVFPDGLAAVLAAVVAAVPAVVAAVVAARRERPTDVLRKVED